MRPFGEMAQAILANLFASAQATVFGAPGEQSRQPGLSSRLSMRSMSTRAHCQQASQVLVAPAC
jgi:hypothetical protein